MVKVTRQIVSSSVAGKVTYSGKNPVNYITVHQTGNTSKGANAKVHANLQSNGNARAASWHYQVDDKEAYQSFEDTAQCWHAGDGQGPGNTQSVAVEICINSDGDYKKSVQHGSELVKQLLDEHTLSIDKVKQHADWANKNCPAQIRAGKDGIGWADFIKMVESESSGGSSGGSGSSSSAPKYNGKSFAQAHSEWWMVKRSETGEAQRLLNQNGYNLVVDDILGQKTLNAIRDYQDKNGISHNGGNYYGVPGPTTLKSLRGSRPKPKSGEGIVDYLKRIKENSSYEARKKLAAQHGISNYRGTAAQNTELLQKISG